MRHLSIIACWHLNYDKIAVKGGVGLIKFVSVQKNSNCLLNHAQIWKEVHCDGQKCYKKKSDFVNIYGQCFLGKYYCNECRQCCFSKYMLLLSLWHSFFMIKKFLSCQHLIVYLSHITIVCPIIASKYIPGSHTSLLAIHSAAWWFAVNRLVSTYTAS